MTTRKYLVDRRAEKTSGQQIYSTIIGDKTMVQETLIKVLPILVLVGWGVVFITILFLAEWLVSTILGEGPKNPVI